MAIKVKACAKITFLHKSGITSNMTQARYDPNYRNTYLFEREFFAPSHRFILKNASNKTSKHMKGGIQGEITDHLTFSAKNIPFIAPNAK